MCVCACVCVRVCVCVHIMIYIYIYIYCSDAEKCSLCYNLTKSTPGFAADPNNCQQFYMCEPAGGPYKWNVFPMKCPDCTFWDQDKLTCVQVDDSCLRSVSVATDEPVTAQRRCRASNERDGWCSQISSQRSTNTSI